MTEDVEINRKNIFYIFLDIDGVLNNETYTLKCYEKHKQPMSMNWVPFDPKCIDNLYILCNMIKQLNMKPLIVLSSTWRLHEIDIEIVKARLAEYGLRIYDKTPYIDQERGKEIDYWLKQHNDYIDYLILDDESFDITGDLKQHLIKTTYKSGFNRRQLIKTREYLKIHYMEKEV